MNIGIDIRNFVVGQLTGVGVYTGEMLHNLFRQDSKNRYKLFFNQSFGVNIKQIRDFNNYSNVTLHYRRLPNKLFNFLLKYCNRPKLDEYIDGCDIFWFPNLNFWQVGGKCKTVVTVHDLSFKKLPWSYSRKMRWWHRAINPQNKFERADKIIAVSESTKRDLVDLYNLPPEKIKVIYSGVNQAPKAKNLKLIRDKYKLPDKFVLYLGTLEPRKNVEGVIRAFEKLNRQDLHLIIAGGKGWLYRKIFKLADRSNVRDRIIFLDYVNQDDRWQLYHNARALIWPSFYEGFGFPPLEAMSVGCPVITSSNSSLSEVVGKAALLIDPYNIQEISFAINQLLTNEALRQSLISKGYEQVKKYSWEKSAQMMLETFKSLDY